MGLFTAIHDTVVTADLLKAAKSINASQHSVISILDRYGYNYDYMNPSDKMLVRGYLNTIEDKVTFMQNRLNDIASYNRFRCMVPCLDGHMTAAPGYIMAAMEFIQRFRQGL